MLSLHLQPCKFLHSAIPGCSLHTKQINMQTTKNETITKRLSFYKENDLWYADLPLFLELGLGTKANLLMVDGSDTFLDLLSQNGTYVTVFVSTQTFAGHEIKLEKIKIGLNQDLLDKIGHAPVDYGAYYNVSKYKNKSFQHTLWLCPVTEYVFEGNYPSSIFLKKLYQR